MVARVFPLGRPGAPEQTETVIAKFQARQGTLVVVGDHARFREAVGERLAAVGERSDFAGRVRAAAACGFLPKEMISGSALATLLAGDQP